MTGFITSVDIANRACQHVGARRINSLSDNSRQAQEIAFCYDKLRAAEMRRSVWRFATRRATLRAVTATTYRFVPAIWAVGTTYAAGAIVKDSAGVYWISMLGSNVGNTPGAVTSGLPSAWQQYFGAVVGDLYSTSVTYNAGDIAYTGSEVFYISLANGNINNPPASGAPWLALSAASSSLVFIPEPVGAAITVNGKILNTFRLPNGFLRLASQDPKVASIPNLSTSGSIQFQDWSLSGGLLVSTASPENDVISPFRFVADVSDVTGFDPLFAEALSARIAYEICETLTQSNVKLQAIGASYQKFMRDARLINQIETGSTEPEESELELTKGPQGVMEGPQQSAEQPQG